MTVIEQAGAELKQKEHNLDKPTTLAEQRRQEAAGSEPALGPELPEAKPADPTRFGDWEKNGRCIDF